MTTPDPLEDLLRTHLHHQLDDTPVAAAQLAHGARRRAVRLKRHRTATTSAGVALTVVSITVAAAHLSRPSPPPARPAASPTAAVSTAITDGQMLRVADLPWRMKLLSSDNARNTPANDLQQCPSSQSEDVLAARSINWTQRAKGSYTVNETITLWGDAATAMRELASDTGACIWESRPTPVAGSTPDLYLATFREASEPGSSAVAVRRDGNRLISITVSGPNGVPASALIKPARQLMARAHTRATD